MFSLMNGLNALGHSIATSAGSAALELQRADLAQQQTILADQLATTREQNVTQPFQAKQQETLLAAEKVRSDATNQTSRDVAGIQSQTSRDVEGMRLKGAENTTQMTIDAEAKRLAAQLEVTGSDITVDAKSGNAIRIDKATGKVTPVTDGEGNPVQLPDNEASKSLTSLLNVTNEELRTVNMQRAQDIRAAQDDLDKASQRPDLFGAEKDAEIARRRKVVAEVQVQYDAPITALQGRLASTAAKMLALRPGIKGATGTGDRPPLSDFRDSAAPLGPRAITPALPSLGSPGSFLHGSY